MIGYPWKAVKLEPNLVDAWIKLGECYWKRGDVDTAKTCFEGALSHVSSFIQTLEWSNIRLTPKDLENMLKVIHSQFEYEE